MAHITQEELMAAMRGGAGSQGLVEAMQARLNSLVGRPSGLIEQLPKPVQKRIKYLQQLQEEFDEQEEEYEKELDALDAKYRAIYEPIFAKRSEVVKGVTEAPESITLETEEGDDTAPPGIPEFWLGVLRANEVTASQITEKDEGVLEYLIDIKDEELTGDDNGFKLIFEFAENPYFENKILTKTYYMADENEPILEKAEGTKINWKPGKNITVKVMKKKPKPGKQGRPITKTEKVDSFFSFFSPPKVPEEEDEDLDEEEMEQLQASLEEDYEIGEVIKDRLIPNAVSWYTGEAAELEEDDEDEEDDDDEDDDEDDDDDEDEDDDDDEEDEDDSPEKGPRGSAKAPKDTKEQPPECKQQ